MMGMMYVHRMPAAPSNDTYRGETKEASDHQIPTSNPLLDDKWPTVVGDGGKSNTSAGMVEQLAASGAAFRFFLHSRDQFEKMYLCNLDNPLRSYYSNH